MSSIIAMPFNWADLPRLPASPTNTKVVKYFHQRAIGDYYVAEWISSNDISVGDHIVESLYTEDGTYVSAPMVTKVARVNFWIKGNEKPRRKSHSCWRLVETIYKKDVDEYLINEATENNDSLRFDCATHKYYYM